MGSRHQSYQFDASCEALIIEYDQARRGCDLVDIQATVTQATEEQRPRLIAELACIDLEHTFEQGRTVEVSPLIDQYPQVFHDEELREEVAYEHYRLSRLLGNQVSCDEIAARYGVSQVKWDELPIGKGMIIAADAVPFPQVGTNFCGYPLVAELGRGALARVFLARQPDLAERCVVLKVTQQLTTEAGQLARLQHSGIIPIFSIHQNEGLFGICMPFLGSVTLASLLADGRLFSQSQDTRQKYVSTLVGDRLSTIVSTIRSASQHDCAPVKSNSRPEIASHAAQIVSPKLVGQEELKEQLGLSELALSLQENYLNRDTIAAKALLMLQLTEAIGYAHSRGVCHRDLKPENILMANDGRPIVLDFNLATSDLSNEIYHVGGTLPYMSPQQLRSIARGGGGSPADDVFAIGVILYQLLTGVLPFDDQQIAAENWFAFAANHEVKPHDCRSMDRRIPASLNSIVMKCLAATVEQRYPSALEVHEDLRRFADNQVLKYAIDRSPMERLHKFVKRHPTFTSTTAVVSVAAMVMAGLLISLMIAQSRARTLEVSHLAAQLRQEVPETLAMLRSPGGESELVLEGIASARGLLKQWKVSEASRPWDRTLRLLSASQRADVARQLGDLSYALSGAEVQLAAIKDEAERRNMLTDAAKWNGLAATLSPELNVVVQWREHRIEELRQFSTANPSESRIGVEPLQAESIYAQMITASEFGNNDLWLKCAEQLVQQRPSDPTHWFSLASAHFSAGNMVRACDAFDVSAKLQKESAMAVLWRGVTHLHASEYALAEDDFSEVIAIRPEWVAPRYNRALANRSQQKFGDAIADLNWIVAVGRAGPRVLSLRSQIHASMGESEKASEDRQLALHTTPIDADDWVTLGVLKIQSAPEAALEDFAQALTLSPHHVAALVNTAHVQSEILQDNEAAIRTLSELIELKLGGAAVLASRGILQARRGAKRDALADARLAAHAKLSPLEMLQIAGIYALTSSGPEEQQLAVAWLARAMSADPSLGSLAAADPDLRSLKSLPAFQVLTALPILMR